MAPLALLAVLVIGALVPAVALGAASSFTGGPDQWPLYVLNDHTPIAVHFVADPGSGLATGTTYYVKVRYTVGTAPSGSSNRGFTWNQSSGLWAQERDAWTSFPTVTTDASGGISSGAWAFVKFGDDTLAGQYHIMVSLSATSGATFNGSFVPTVTVLDPRIDGGWVHNGVATGKSAATRAIVTDEASTVVYSVNKTEGQLVDDDSNGVVDDEDWGPVGNTGDFCMSVPALSAIGINLNKTTWTPGNGFVSGPADVNLAISAADTMAPTAPGLVGGVGGDMTAALTWTSALDNTAVSGYYVYRWTAAPFGAAYSPVHSRIATLGAGETSYEDSGLTNGVAYMYEIRAFDASTNVGPRSATATVTPAVMVPDTLVTPATPDGNDGWYITAPTVEMSPGSGRTCYYSFETVPSTWTTYTAPIPIPSGQSKLSYYESDGVLSSDIGTLTFKVDTTAPRATLASPALSVPWYVGRSFKVAWNGSDAGSGVDAYEVRYRTSTVGAWVTWRSGTTAKSAVFTGAAGSNNYFQARVYDIAGNVSPWTAVACTVVPYDQNKAWYSSGWSTAYGPGFYLGSSRYTTKKGAAVSMSFTRGTLYLVARSGPKMGKYAVYYRGARIGTVNLYSATSKLRQTFKLVSKTTGTTAYPVKLVNLGIAGRTRVEFDGFAIKR